MKKILMLCLSSAFLFSFSRAQSDNGGATKAVYGELGGSGLIFSANFDMRFKGSTGLGFRLGIGGAGGTGGGVVTFPFGLNYVSGKGDHHFEAGTTFTVVTAAFDISDNGSTWFLLPHFGYRYSKPSNSFNARIYIGPLIGDGFVFFPFGGLSVGYTLK